MTDRSAPSASRREFVGGLALGLGGLVASATMAGAQSPDIPNAPTGRPQPELETTPPGPADQRLGWAVIGLGDFAQGYVLPALARARASRVAGLVSGNEDKLRAVGSQYGVPEAARFSYDRMGDMRDEAAIDVAYVVTPNSTHAELVVKAFEAGKHVMCEKPMATSSADCQRMIDAARAADRKLMVAYRAHFEPSNVKLKEMLDAGELGDVLFANSDHHRPLEPSLPRDQWRMKKVLAGGGSLVDIGIYSLNGLIWFLGELPNRVSATIVQPPGDARFAEVEDIAAAQLEFPSGKRIHISSGYQANKKRIDLFGSKATAVLDPATAYGGNRLRVTQPEGTLEVLVETPSAEQFTREIDHLSHAIREGGEVLTPGEMGLRDLRLIEAIYRSAEIGQPVDLAPDMTMKG
ncbi:Gfo/Idh/MocA family protein [Aureimonas ureilytica]|uniref:Gfo/Idh/MocA family protein n=1 Tax=Aureimonas ureilytica TaxID=401562 RepID=UPI003CE7EC1F